VRLVRNPRFRQWSRDAQPSGYPDVIAATIVNDSSAEVSRVLSGRADIALPGPFEQPPRQLRALTTRFAAQLHLDPLGAVFYLFLNTRRPPFDNLSARRAVAYAVDRGRLAELAGGTGAAEPTCQVLPPDFPGYQPYCPYTLHTSAGGIWTAPDGAKAARFLARSHARGSRVTIGTFSDLTYLARPLEAVLARLGFRVSLRTLSPAGTLFPRVDAILNAWTKDYPAPSDFIDPLFTCRAFVNISGFCDPTVDSQARRAAAIQVSDPATANRLWAAIDRKLVDNVAAVPLYVPQSITVLSRRVGNYEYNPQWGPLVDQLWIR
jgi:peptide/nickel transport system substrate-binding protein